MAETLVIPTSPGEPYYTQRTKLDGREYNLRFAWNERAARWHLDILSDAEEPLLVGIKLVCNWPLLRFAQWDDRVPPGDLRVTDLSQDGSPPGFLELGEDLRCVLTYAPKTDL